MSNRKKLILDTVEDLVINFVGYDRRDDEDLPKNSINEAIDYGEITVNEIADKFRIALKMELMK